MNKILKKYIYLNNKNILIGFFVALFFSTIAYDGNKYYFTGLLMVPSFLFSFIIGKMCYTESLGSTREFLLSLPIGKKSLIIEKYIGSIFCSCTGIFLVNLIFYLINNILFSKNFSPNLNACLIVLIFLMFYNNTYIYINYRFDYSKTQLTTYIILILMIFLFKFGWDLMFNIQKINSYILILFLILVSFISFGLLNNIKIND